MECENKRPYNVIPVVNGVEDTFQIQSALKNKTRKTDTT